MMGRGDDGQQTHVPHLQSRNLQHRHGMKREKKHSSAWSLEQMGLS